MNLKKIFFNFGKEKKIGKEQNALQTQLQLDKKLVTSLTKSKIPNFKQLRYLPKFLSPKEKWILKISFAIILISLIFLGSRIYLEHVKYLPRSGGEYIEGLIGYPEHINPIYAPANDIDADISKLIFAGLLKYNQNLELVPDLAEKYEISPDGKTYIFYLKENVKWHDNENFDADDVIFTISCIQNPEFKSPLNSAFRGVKVEKIDQMTVKFSLENPFAPFLELLTVGILPEHLWNNISPPSAILAELNLKPVGLGPYKFKSLIKDKFGNIKSYTLARNENYFGPQPFLEKITFKFYSDYESAINALQNKEVLGIAYLPTEFKEKLKRKNLKIYSFDLPQYTAIFLNYKNNEVLKDKKIRQALAYAIDKTKIITEVLKNEAKSVYGPIFPWQIGYHPEIKKYNFNQEESAKLLDEAGYKLIDGKRKKDEKILKINLTTADNPILSNVAEIIKQNWQSLGIEVNVTVASASQIQQEIIKPQNYEAFLYSEIVGFDPDPFPFWHSSQIGGLNLSLFSNRHADKLLEDARQTLDPTERQKNYIEFQNILAEEVPAIFLYRSIYLYPVDKKVKGINIKYINMPHDRFINIEERYIKTKAKFD